MTDPLLIDIPTPILTPHLMIRPVQAGDGAAVYEAWQESYEELHRWKLGCWWKPREAMTVEDAELFCRRKQISFLTREQLVFLIFDREDGSLLGQISLNNCNWQDRILSLGYWIRTAATNKGYATEAATALTRFAFETLSARKVTSFHAAGNLASQRVLEKTGFQREGTLRAQHELHGTWVDEVVYGMLKEEQDNLHRTI